VIRTGHSVKREPDGAAAAPTCWLRRDAWEADEEADEDDDEDAMLPSPLPPPTPCAVASAPWQQQHASHRQISATTAARKDGDAARTAASLARLPERGPLHLRVFLRFGQLRGTCCRRRRRRLAIMRTRTLPHPNAFLPRPRPNAFLPRPRPLCPAQRLLGGCASRIIVHTRRRSCRTLGPGGSGRVGPAHRRFCGGRGGRGRGLRVGPAQEHGMQRPSAASLARLAPGGATACACSNGCLIEAPWLVNGRHGASLSRWEGRTFWNNRGGGALAADPA
jgi:hypothetical protein